MKNFLKRVFSKRKDNEEDKKKHNLAQRVTISHGPFRTKKEVIDHVRKSMGKDWQHIILIEIDANETKVYKHIDEY